MTRFMFVTLLAYFGVVSIAEADFRDVNAPPTGTRDLPPAGLSRVNDPIRVADRATVDNLHNVNGSITLGEAATANSVSSVNGDIALGPNSTVQFVKTNNGSISVDTGAHVAGSIYGINSAIVLEPSADVTGRLTSVNGGLLLHSAHVGGGIETVNGRIDIGAGSRVEGGILVRCTRGMFDVILRKSCPASVVTIGPGAIVQGELQFEHDVTLYVSTRARVGPIEGARAIAFSGDHPIVGGGGAAE